MLAPREAHRAIRCIILALVRIHGGGLYHGDVKPDNILVPDPNDLGHVVLADFSSSSKKRAFEALHYGSLHGFIAVHPG